MKPSITYWNRVEPSPRSDSLARGLEAQVRDPLWFLTRQWQMGEFRGEDAASPAYVSVAATFTRFANWQCGNGGARPIDGSTPLEALIEKEPATPDWRLAVELGQILERELVAVGAGDASIAIFRAAYPVPRVDELSAEDTADPALGRFLRVCGGRATDGNAAFAAAEAALPSLPPGLAFPQSEVAAVTTALATFRDQVLARWGRPARLDAASWRRERLDYGADVETSTRSRQRLQYRAHPGSHGDFDWFAFDVVEETRAGEAASSSAIHASLFPANVSFPGMPADRWWYFENARFDWAAVDMDRRDIARTLVLDFVLIHGTDWFVIPLGQPVGSLATIGQLLVRDVFGELTLVSGADADPGPGARRWTMFTNTVEGGTPGVADGFLLPPSVLRATLDGQVMEEVRFFRDEQANMVWAVESVIENGIGRPWSGRERSLALAADPPPLPETSAPLRYRLQTAVPLNWIPFLPVQIDADHRAVTLERAAMTRLDGAELADVMPVGRILNPSGLNGAPYRINEEEVERHGTRIERAWRRARWIDGSTHLWISRKRRAGFGEGASGLRFDIAATGTKGSGS